MEDEIKKKIMEKLNIWYGNKPNDPAFIELMGIVNEGFQEIKEGLEKISWRDESGFPIEFKQKAWERFWNEHNTN